MKGGERRPSMNTELCRFLCVFHCGLRRFFRFLLRRNSCRILAAMASVSTHPREQERESPLASEPRTGGA